MKRILKLRFPGLLQLLRVLKLSWQTRTFIPRKVLLSYSSNLLFANPFESRGFALLKNKGRGQPYIKKFWRIAVSLFNPQLVLDIGANYGEIFLDTHYPNSIKKIVAFEANPLLSKYLLSSKNAHPLSQKIELVNGLVAKQNKENVTFFIDKFSSGRSTALKNNFVKSVKMVSVNSYRLDDYLKDDMLLCESLVFKIDVEGFEPFVLDGMTGILNSKSNLIGCLEFNLTSLRKNDIDIDQYLVKLNSYFHFLALLKNGQIVDIESLSTSVLRKIFNNKYIEGDILVFSNQNQKLTFKKKYNNE